METKVGNRYVHAHFSGSVRPKTAQASFLLAKQVQIQINLEQLQNNTPSKVSLIPSISYLLHLFFSFCIVHPQNHLCSADSTQDHQKTGLTVFLKPCRPSKIFELVGSTRLQSGFIYLLLLVEINFSSSYRKKTRRHIEFFFVCEKVYTNFTTLLSYSFYCELLKKCTTNKNVCCCF